MSGTSDGPLPAQTNAPLVGAIRWDAWEDGGGIEQLGVEQTLGPGHWHYRLPFFAQVVGSNSVSIEGNSATIMDQEINYAANAGISYWAFVVYSDYDEMADGLKLYLNSALKSRIHFALILDSGVVNADTTGWSAQVARYRGVSCETHPIKLRCWATVRLSICSGRWTARRGFPP